MDIGTALAWSLGLLAFFAVTSPLWQPGQPPVVVAVVGVLGGLCMAIVMAAGTGLTLVHILDHGTTRSLIADIQLAHRFGLDEMQDAYDIFARPSDSGALKVALFRS